MAIFFNFHDVILLFFNTDIGHSYFYSIKRFLFFFRNGSLKKRIAQFTVTNPMLCLFHIGQRIKYKMISLKTLINFCKSKRFFLVVKCFDMSSENGSVRSDCPERLSLYNWGIRKSFRRYFFATALNLTSKKINTPIRIGFMTDQRVP